MATIDISTMTVEEMAFWLESDEPQAVAWRTDESRVQDVGATIARYCEETGQWRQPIGARIEAERAALWEQAAEAANTAQAQSALLAVAKSDWLSSGGSEVAFEEAVRLGYLDELLRSGRAKELVSQDVASRRARAASTW
jgi:hypothetical protein